MDLLAEYEARAMGVGPCAASRQPDPQQPEGGGSCADDQSSICSEPCDLGYSYCEWDDDQECDGDACGTASTSGWLQLDDGDGPAACCPPGMHGPARPQERRPAPVLLDMEEDGTALRYCMMAEDRPVCLQRCA